MNNLSNILFALTFSPGVSLTFLLDVGIELTANQCQSVCQSYSGFELINGDSNTSCFLLLLFAVIVGGAMGRIQKNNDPTAVLPHNPSQSLVETCKWQKTHGLNQLGLTGPPAF